MKLTRLKSIKTAIKQVKCLRCGHKWFPKKPGFKAKTCPSCHSPYWDLPIKRKSTSIASKKNSTKFENSKAPTMQELVLKSIKKGNHLRKEIQKDLNVPVWNIDGAITKLRRNRIITVSGIGRYYEKK